MSEPTVLADRYELRDKLGSGGMSNVYRATDRILERTVAVKVLAEHLSDDDRFVARFRREALAVAKLIHIVPREIVGHALYKFRALAITGEIPTTDPQPAARHGGVDR